MANQPHPDKLAVTFRLHRDLVAQVRAEAARRNETVADLVTRALRTEVQTRSVAEVGALTIADGVIDALMSAGWTPPDGLVIDVTPADRAQPRRMGPEAWLQRAKEFNLDPRTGRPLS